MSSADRSGASEPEKSDGDKHETRLADCGPRPPPRALSPHPGGRNHCLAFFSFSRRSSTRNSNTNQVTSPRAHSHIRQWNKGKGKFPGPVFSRTLVSRSSLEHLGLRRSRRRRRSTHSHIIPGKSYRPTLPRPPALRSHPNNLCIPTAMRRAFINMRMHSSSSLPTRLHLLRHFQPSLGH